MKALRGKTIGFIGAGTMGQALIRGLLARGVSRRALYAADPSAAIRRRVGALGVRVTAENARVACAADVLVLAVKPQEMRVVLRNLAPMISRRQVVISIAAGVPLAVFQSVLWHTPVIRVMPNLPATVGLGFAAYTPGRHAGPAHRAIAEAIFSAVGDVVRVAEHQLDAITAVSGSGPAYLFFLAQAWEDAGVALGLSATVARRAVRQTLAGSLKLLDRGDLSPQAWMAKVTSKRGTTEAALRVLARRRVRQHVAEALRAAARRSRELSRG